MNLLPIPHSFSHFLLIFVFRHWLTAFVNAGLTALLGLGLVRGVERLGWPRLSPLPALHLRRLVLLTAMLKAAFYLLRGTAVSNYGQTLVALGIQFPDPHQWVGLAPMSTINIWHPTTATALVTALLAGSGIAFLIWRAGQLIASQSQMHSFIHLQSAKSEPRLPELLLKAARALGIPPQKTLPKTVVVAVPFATPLLLGLRCPMILISPSLMQALSDTELEMALRHELAHCLRHDQWWRWLQTWLEDVGRLSGLSRLLGTHALTLEEEICDRMAVHTTAEVLALARALTKATQFSASACQGSSITLPEEVVPALLGRHTRIWNEPLVLSRRLQALTTYSAEISANQTKHHLSEMSVGIRNPVTWIINSFRLLGEAFGWLIFSLLLIIILYVKVHVVVGHF